MRGRDAVCHEERGRSAPAARAGRGLEFSRHMVLFDGPGGRKNPAAHGAPRATEQD